MTGCRRESLSEVESDTVDDARSLLSLPSFPVVYESPESDYYLIYFKTGAKPSQCGVTAERYVTLGSGPEVPGSNFARAKWFST